jgi:Fe2+ transport system protein FeoA
MADWRSAAPDTTGGALAGDNGSGAPKGSGPVRLSALRAGDSARLHRRELSEGENCLLAAMGLTEGCRIVVCSHGDPCIVEVRTTRIGLARSVAERLLVLADLDTSG